MASTEVNRCYLGNIDNSNNWPKIYQNYAVSELYPSGTPTYNINLERLDLDDSFWFTTLSDVSGNASVAKALDNQSITFTIGGTSDRASVSFAMDNVEIGQEYVVVVQLTGLQETTGDFELVTVSGTAFSTPPIEKVKVATNGEYAIYFTPDQAGTATVRVGFHEAGNTANKTTAHFSVFKASESEVIPPQANIVSIRRRSQATTRDSSHRVTRTQGVFQPNTTDRFLGQFSYDSWGDNQDPSNQPIQEPIDQLASMLGQCVLVGASQGGRNMETMNTILGDILNQKNYSLPEVPNFFIIEGSTNSLDGENTGEDLLGYASEMLDKVNASSIPNALITDMTPASKTGQRESSRTTYNSNIVSLAKNKKATLVPWQEPVTDPLNTSQLEPIYAIDTTHVNELGSYVAASALYKALEFRSKTMPSFGLHVEDPSTELAIAGSISTDRSRSCRADRVLLSSSIPNGGVLTSVGYFATYPSGTDDFEVDIAIYECDESGIPDAARPIVFKTVSNSALTLPVGTASMTKFEQVALSVSLDSAKNYTVCIEPKELNAANPNFSIGQGSPAAVGDTFQINGNGLGLNMPTPYGVADSTVSQDHAVFAIYTVNGLPPRVTPNFLEAPLFTFTSA